MRQTFRYNDHPDLVLLGCVENERPCCKTNVRNTNGWLLLLRRTSRRRGDYSQQNETGCMTTNRVRHGRILRAETLPRVAPLHKICHAQAPTSSNKENCKMYRLFLACAVLMVIVIAPNMAFSQNSPNMSFFITSAGSGNGANLSGLTGADAICQRLAAAAGAGSKTWRAYLSTSAMGNQPAVNARDRIGRGPWQNAKGVVVAQSG